MPIYEYECTNCGHRFECLQSVNDAPLVLCPECKKKKLKKCVALSSFRLKGSGWYATDAKKEKTADKKSGEDKTGKTDKEEKKKCCGKCKDCKD